MEDMFKLILNKLDNLSQDVSSLKVGQGRLEQEIAGLKTGQGRLEQEISDLRVGQGRLEQEVSGLKVGQDRLEQEIAGLKTGQGRLEQEISGLKAGQGRLEQEVSGLKAGQKELFNLAQSLEHRVEENTAQLNFVVENLHQVNGRLANIEKDMAGIKEELVHHSNLLDVMAVRSTRHEAEILSLKRAK